MGDMSTCFPRQPASSGLVFAGSDTFPRAAKPYRSNLTHQNGHCKSCRIKILMAVLPSACQEQQQSAESALREAEELRNASQSFRVSGLEVS